MTSISGGGCSQTLQHEHLMKRISSDRRFWMMSQVDQSQLQDVSLCSNRSTLAFRAGGLHVHWKYEGEADAALAQISLEVLQSSKLWGLAGFYSSLPPSQTLCDLQRLAANVWSETDTLWWNGGSEQQRGWFHEDSSSDRSWRAAGAQICCRRKLHRSHGLLRTA